MFQIRSFSLLITLVFSISAFSQSYEKQYDICSQALKGLQVVDPMYLELVSKRDSCLTGTYAPNFKASSIDNKIIELANLKGQVVVLNFWYTKCKPCIEDMPDLNKLVEYYSDKKVAFISFAPEDSSTLTKFLLTHPFKFKTISNSESIRRDIFKLLSVWPYTIIIDKEGKINRMDIGSFEKETFNYYQNIIDQLL